MTSLKTTSTAREVVAALGAGGGDRVYMVTGCSSGIGLECALALVSTGATIIAACRPGEKAQAAYEALKVEAEASGGRVHLLPVNLGDTQSVAELVGKYSALKLPLHALVANAGINGVPEWGKFTPGVESTLRINFLGHFQLAHLLHDKLVATPGSRLVVLSSDSHRRVSADGFDVDSELPPREENYNMFHAYAFSNLCRLLWVREMAKSVPYPVVALHPGVVSGTSIMQHMSWKDKVRQIWIVLRRELAGAIRLQSVAQAAATQTWAAMCPLENVQRVSGAYLNGNIGRILGDADTPSALGCSDELAARIFQFALNYFQLQHYGSTC